MLINELAKTYKISIRTLRYYEEIGLLTSTRNSSNIRVYDDTQIEKLELILLLKMLNFNLTSIKEILNSKDKALLGHKLRKELENLTINIDDLNHKRQVIKSLLQAFRTEEISTTSIQSFIQEQLYFKAEEERTIAMLEKSDTVILEIGTGLIPIALPENKEPLLKAIKQSREELETLYKENLKPVRVRDKEEDLDPLSYQIIYKNKTLLTSTLTSEDQKIQVDTIITALKPYLLLSK